MIHLRNISTIFLFFLYSIIHNTAVGQNIIYQFDINQEIGPNATRIVERAISTAQEKKAAFLLLNLDTYGGLVDDADKIRTALLKCPIPTMVYIKNNAASAGALISIACDSIYMANGSTIGAASVVNEAGELAPEKYQSYMRKKLSATAKETGRNPLIAEGMADEQLVIDSIKPAGKIITLSVDEAIKYGYCNAKLAAITDIPSRLGGTYIIEKQNPTFWDNVIAVLLSPFISSILLFGIFAGIFFELKSPGTLFPLGFSVFCALLYLYPHHIDGAADYWEIVLFIIGLVLLMLEIFVIPGFGITGISGILLILMSLTLAMLHNQNLDFSQVGIDQLGNSLLIVVLAMLSPFLLLLAFGKNLFNSPAFAKISVKGEMNADKGYSVLEQKMLSYIGKKGIVKTDMRPVGKINIAGEIIEASSESDFLAADTVVIVIGTRGNYLIVKKETI